MELLRRILRARLEQRELAMTMAQLEEHIDSLHCDLVCLARRIARIQRIESVDALDEGEPEGSLGHMVDREMDSERHGNLQDSGRTDRPEQRPDPLG